MIAKIYTIYIKYMYIQKLTDINMDIHISSYLHYIYIYIALFIQVALYTALRVIGYLM